MARKRGRVLNNFKKDIKDYKKKKEYLSRFRSVQAESPKAGLQEDIEFSKSDIDKAKEIIKAKFLLYTAEFSGMCLFWLKNDTNLEIDFIEKAA